MPPRASIKLFTPSITSLIPCKNSIKKSSSRISVYKSSNAAVTWSRAASQPSA
jgi:hypothetical protein